MRLPTVTPPSQRTHSRLGDLRSERTDTEAGRELAAPASPDRLDDRAASERSAALSRRRALAREPLLVLRAQTGDREAYGRLHDLYRERLLGYLRRLLGPRADQAEDVLQEVWITMIRRLASLEQPEAFGSWLYRIAHNGAVSALRRQRREPSGADVEEEVDPVSEDDSWLEQFDPAVLEQALQRLSHLHREVLTLHFLDALS